LSSIPTSGTQNKYDATTPPTVSNDNTEGYTVGSRWIDVTADNIYDCVDASTGAAIWLRLTTIELNGFAASDEDTAITVGTAKVTFRMPFAMYLLGIRANVKTAPTGASIIFDFNESGFSVLSTRLSIDATEKTSVTAATPLVISDPNLADDAEITIDFDQVGATVAGTGVKFWLYGYKR